VKNSY